MTDAVTIYHNPRCSKSRETLSLCCRAAASIHRWCFISTHRRMPIRCVSCAAAAGYGEPPRAHAPEGGSATNRLNLADQALSDAALIQAMVDNPKLIERPIVVSRGQARIGRPPEQVLRSWLTHLRRAFAALFFTWPIPDLPRQSLPPAGRCYCSSIAQSTGRMNMKKPTSTPHDAVFKTYLSHPDTARDFLQLYLPGNAA
ncbi:Rpn family recombination-promoting nuclease/putative transposase [Klebsiella variicola subsp. variicola]|nr:Rpn family recombination-promoting nuclease/putative transposase [Klebsiella variicola subsp. variicola]